MCGRYGIDVPEGDWINELKVDMALGADLGVRYNIAPTQPIRIVLEATEQRQTRTARWGLVPSWAKDPSIGGRMINARSETVTEKPSFRSAAAKRRCIIPASGYYEWQAVVGGKQPYYLHPQGDGLLAFAGLYEIWTPRDEPDADPLWTATIITTAAPDALGHVHDRTPVILPESMWDDWLSPEVTEKADVIGMLAAAPEPRLTPTPVGKAVGNVRNQGPGLIEPVDA